MRRTREAAGEGIRRPPAPPKEVVAWLLSLEDGVAPETAPLAAGYDGDEGARAAGAALAAALGKPGRPLFLPSALLPPLD